LEVRDRIVERERRMLRKRKARKENKKDIEGLQATEIGRG